MQNRELLNRIQAKDLHAFASLQYNTNGPEPGTDVYVPRSDEAEARVMVEQYGQLEGFGDVIYDEQEQDILKDLGIDLK